RNLNHYHPERSRRIPLQNWWVTSRDSSTPLRSAQNVSASEMTSFTDLFIKRPILAIVVRLVILIAGLQAMKTLNVRQYPRSDIASITVTTVYVGADAELI